MNLTQKTFIGIFWNISEQLLSRGVGVIVTLLLARFLSPADYGLIAMMSLFMSIASLVMQSGFLTALIRLKETTQDDLNTAFYANLSLGALSYALLFVCAPFIADFYDEIRLVSLVRVTGVVVVINSFQIVQSAILNRKLDFQNQFRASLVAGISSGVVAVGLAFAGLGVWALVSQMLLGAFLTTVLLWHFQRWRPSLSFSKKSFLDMYSFG
ncbi:MAG: oligosaccharide flippase family protein, partial [Smithella sp.]|nr:oligosaccharide flippase family protein [Smithella sp.]